MPEIRPDRLRFAGSRQFRPGREIAGSKQHEAGRKQHGEAAMTKVIILEQLARLQSQIERAEAHMASDRARVRHPESWGLSAITAKQRLKLQKEMQAGLLAERAFLHAALV